jgi:hypothetical protein
MNVPAVPVIAMVGYYLKFAMFTAATPSTKDANMVAIGK